MDRITLIILLAILLTCSSSVFARPKVKTTAGSMPMDMHSRGRAVHVEALETGATNYDSSMIWGTYRPGIYFGMRTRTHKGLMTGLAWHNPDEMAPMKLRHKCQNEDVRYTWTEHDGRNYGIEKIEDPDLGIEMEISFVKMNGHHPQGGDWVARIRGRTMESAEKPKNLALLFYFSAEVAADVKGTNPLSINGLKPNYKRSGITGPVRVDGKLPDLGDFSAFVMSPSGTTSMKAPDCYKSLKNPPDFRKFQFLTTSVTPFEAYMGGDMAKFSIESNYRRTFMEILDIENHKMRMKNVNEADHGAQMPRVSASLPNTAQESSNIVIVESLLQLPQERTQTDGESEFDFGLDIVFVSHGAHGNSAKNPASLLSVAQDLVKSAPRRIKRASDAFNSRFDKTFPIDNNDKEEKKRWGHVGRCAVSSLLGGMSYVYGNSVHVDSITRKTGFTTSESLFSTVPARSMFPRGFLWDEGFHQLIVKKWDVLIHQNIMKDWWKMTDPVGWIPREQIRGDEARSRVPTEFITQKPTIANPPTLLLSLVPSSSTSFSSSKYNKFISEIYNDVVRHVRWLFRTQRDGLARFRWRGADGNHTLACGLDDYPRWNPGSTRSESSIEAHVDLSSWLVMAARSVRAIAESGLKGVNAIDVDIDEFDRLEKEAMAAVDALWNTQAGAYCDAIGEKPVCHIGYVSILPLALGLLDADNVRDRERINSLLDIITDPQQLWTPFGLRSLSVSDHFYGKDENYWRGPIWVNINYLVVSGLKEHYSSIPRAVQVSEELRENVVRNIVREFERTGYFWEQYNSENGKGQGAHPFTGWTALVVLMMSSQ